MDNDQQDPRIDETISAPHRGDAESPSVDGARDTDAQSVTGHHLAEGDGVAVLRDEATDQSEASGSPDAPPSGNAAGSAEPNREETGAAEVMTVDAVMDATRPGAIAQPVSEQLVVVIEAIVFASPEPITFKAILKLLDTEPKEQVQAAIGELKRRYDDRPGGLQIVEVANGYQIVTRPELHEWVRRMFHERTTQKLSVQALETLAVIAYKQPITAAEITEIRGVNTSGVIGTLLERGLVKISGRRQVVGRPFLYSTTRDFLDRFGLRDLNDLPKVEDMAGVLGFEVPAGLVADVPRALPADEPATEEDVAVMTGDPEGEQRDDEQG
jgi:segregation and condensation protein B